MVNECGGDGATTDARVEASWWVYFFFRGMRRERDRIGVFALEKMGGPLVGRVSFGEIDD